MSWENSLLLSIMRWDVSNCLVTNQSVHRTVNFHQPLWCWFVMTGNIKNNYLTDSRSLWCLSLPKYDNISAIHCCVQYVFLVLLHFLHNHCWGTWMLRLFISFLEIHVIRKKSWSTRESLSPLYLSYVKCKTFFFEGQSHNSQTAVKRINVIWKYNLCWAH